MPHAEIRNRTRFAYANIIVCDEEAVPQYVSLVHAEYSFADPAALVLLEQQAAPNLAGEWHGDPAESSMRLEPQFAFVKPATDVVLLGHAHAPHVGATTMQVGIMVGPLRKLARVFGDRHLVTRSGVSAMSVPAPFEKIPLIYERAFGGWDRREEDAALHTYETRNPVGTGFRNGAARGDDEFLVPNLEDPEDPFDGFGKMPTPAGFGFISPNWQPRLALAGTYDEAWDRKRKPLLPEDFDRRFYNSASPGLIAPGYLLGNEPVALLGVTDEDRIGFHLPSVPPPMCTIHQRAGKQADLAMNLDTLVVDADRRVLTLTWRATLPLRDGPHEVIAVDVLSSADT